MILHFLTGCGKELKTKVAADICVFSNVNESIFAIISAVIVFCVTDKEPDVDKLTIGSGDYTGKRPFHWPNILLTYRQKLGLCSLLTSRFLSAVFFFK